MRSASIPVASIGDNLSPPAKKAFYKTNNVGHLYTIAFNRVELFCYVYVCVCILCSVYKCAFILLQGYRLFLETSLSKKLYDYSSSDEVLFSADQPSRAINLKFHTQVRSYTCTRVHAYTGTQDASRVCDWCMRMFCDYYFSFC